MDQIKIGWGEVSLVPEGRKVNLYGQFYERITSEVESPITVTALALECGKESAIFCSCDLVDTSHMLLESVRAIVRERCPELPVDQCDPFAYVHRIRTRIRRGGRIEFDGFERDHAGSKVRIARFL